MVRVTENTMEPSAHGKGFVNYLLDGVNPNNDLINYNRKKN